MRTSLLSAAILLLVVGMEVNLFGEPIPPGADDELRQDIPSPTIRFDDPEEIQVNPAQPPNNDLEILEEISRSCQRRVACYRAHRVTYDTCMENCESIGSSIGISIIAQVQYQQCRTQCTTDLGADYLRCDTMYPCNPIPAPGPAAQ